MIKYKKYFFEGDFTVVSKKNALRGTPVVCAVNDTYLICVPVNKPVLMSVEINGKEYFCHSNGIKISDTSVQKFKVPMTELDEAKKYTLKYEVLHLRTPYYCEKDPEVKTEYSFKPIEKKTDINIYHISDVHGIRKQAIDAGRFFGDDLDLLILNGDIASSSASKEDIMLSYDIASAITGGTVPCIISRGNHDLRGKYAEKLEQFLPTDNGRSYYTVKLGPIWMLLLDCGEDKLDSHREYSGTVCCHRFRLDQCEYIEQLKQNAGNEYLSDKFDYRFIVSHVPFNFNNTDECRGERPFNIELDLYDGWCRFAREDVKAQMLISGHYHRASIAPSGCDEDCKRIGCDTVIGGIPYRKNGRPTGFTGAAITLKGKTAEVRFTTHKGEVLSVNTVKLK